MDLSRTLRPFSFALIFVLVFTLLGFRVAHPKSGLRSAAGAADSSIVAYKHTETFGRGDKVIIKLDKASISPAIGIIQLVEENSVQVQTGDLLINVPKESIKGKLFGVFPFIGTIFSIIGM